MHPPFRWSQLQVAPGKDQMVVHELPWINPLSRPPGHGLSGQRRKRRLQRQLNVRFMHPEKATRKEGIFFFPFLFSLLLVKL